MIPEAPHADTSLLAAERKNLFGCANYLLAHNYNKTWASEQH
jgi:hypothetical protein